MNVVRLGDLISIDGTMIIEDKNGNWKEVNGRSLNAVRLTALFNFFHEEIRCERKRFHNYVNRIVTELIYNDVKH